jgi:hypothetical protein
MILIAVFVVNAGYGFKGSLTTLDSTSFNSQLFRTLDKPPLNKVPVPLPSEFVQGFDRQKLDAEQGVFLNYLRGKPSRVFVLPVAWLPLPPIRFGSGIFDSARFGHTCNFFVFQ